MEVVRHLAKHEPEKWSLRGERALLQTHTKVYLGGQLVDEHPSTVSIPVSHFGEAEYLRRTRSRRHWKA